MSYAAGEPPQIPRQTAQRHRCGPLLRAEEGVRAAVDENHTATEEIGGVRQHETHPVGEMACVAVSADRYRELPYGGTLARIGELGLQQWSQDGTRGQRVQADTRTGPLCGDRIDP